MKRSKARLTYGLFAIAGIIAIALYLHRNYTGVLNSLSEAEPAAQAQPAGGMTADELRPSWAPPEDMKPTTRPCAAATEPTTAPAATAPAPSAPPAEEAASKPSPAPAAAAALPPVQIPTTAPSGLSNAGSAGEKLREGLAKMAAGELLPARQLLADALNSGLLDEASQDTARDKLTELGRQMLFSRQAVPGDPFTFVYPVRPGDLLTKIEREQKLHVPTQLLLGINGITDPSRIQVGQGLKVIRGPFHAVVSKSRYTMDIYLVEPDTSRMVFVKRFRVGLGKDEGTPLGKWRLALGGKIVKAPWNPPPSAGMAAGTVRWGEPNYPLGKDGFWISLEGIEGNALTAADGFGIHGTNEPDSIGKSASHGCVRMADADIYGVFCLLYEYWSTVNVVP